MAGVGNGRTTVYSTIAQATTLGWDGDECARNYMQQLMFRGHAILLAHNWKIKHLKEFYPRSVRLLGLNVNKGDEVCLRFRAPGAKNTFLPFHEVLCTLLHEIAHCKYSAHNKYFWKLYTQLVAECEQLELSTTMGDTLLASCNSFHNFFATGRRLGGGQLTLRHNSPSTRRQLLADAAQRRLQKSRWDVSGGCARDGAAAAAAPCGSSNNTDGCWVCKRCGNENSPPLTTCDFCSDAAADTENKNVGWNCKRCTFHNYGNLQFCGVCNFSSLTAAVGELGSGVQHVKGLAAWTDDLTVYSLLGSVADVFDPFLLAKGWQIASLVEFSPLAQAIVSQGVFLDNTRLIVKVRLFSPTNTSEFMPVAYVYAAVLHQLAHMIERSHGVLFLKTWAFLLREFLHSERAQKELLMTSIVKDSLLHFAAQLEHLLEAHKCGIEGRPERMSSFNFLFADCGNAMKRERATECKEDEDDDEEEEEEERVNVVERRSCETFEGWLCTRCSLLNHVSAFLFCEVCGMSRSFCTLHGEEAMGRCEELPIIIDDDEDDESRDVDDIDGMRP